MQNIILTDAEWNMVCTAICGQIAEERRAKEDSPQDSQIRRYHARQEANWKALWDVLFHGGHEEKV